MKWTGNFASRVRLELTLKSLTKAMDEMPDTEIVPTQFGFFVNLCERDVDPIISEYVCTGFSKDVNVAFLKALSEYMERHAFREGKSNGLNACQTPRSDGFAAYPLILCSNRHSNLKARQNAIQEAIERYVWASWWDNPHVAHSILELGDLQIWEPDCQIQFKNLPLTSKPIRFFGVLPKLDSKEHVLLILICQLDNGGFVSGGACGTAGAKRVIFERAFAELFRHCLALSRFVELSAKPAGFYQERLHFFGFGEGYDLVIKRLQHAGHESVSLPKLKYDERIIHKFQSIFVVHRCFFEGQPLFMGGDVDRFCI